MDKKSITNYLLNVSFLVSKENNVSVKFLSEDKFLLPLEDKNGDEVAFTTKVTYKLDDNKSGEYKLYPTIRLVYNYESPEEIIKQVKEKVMECVEEQLETDRMFDSAIVNMVNDAELKNIEPYINKEYYNLLDAAIKNNSPIVIPSEVTKCVPGKTSTMAYLAIEHDLPLIVFSEKQAKMLKNKYPDINIVSGFKSKLVDKYEKLLVDEAEVGVVKHVNGDKILIGFDRAGQE